MENDFFNPYIEEKEREIDKTLGDMAKDAAKGLLNFVLSFPEGLVSIPARGLQQIPFHTILSPFLDDEATAILKARAGEVAEKNLEQVKTFVDLANYFTNQTNALADLIYMTSPYTSREEAKEYAKTITAITNLIFLASGLYAIRGGLKKGAKFAFEKAKNFYDWAKRSPERAREMSSKLSGAVKDYVKILRSKLKPAENMPDEVSRQVHDILSDVLNTLSQEKKAEKARKIEEIKKMYERSPGFEKLLKTEKKILTEKEKTDIVQSLLKGRNLDEETRKQVKKAIMRHERKKDKIFSRVAEDIAEYGREYRKKIEDMIKELKGKVKEEAEKVGKEGGVKELTKVKTATTSTSVKTKGGVSVGKEQIPVDVQTFLRKITKNPLSDRLKEVIWKIAEQKDIKKDDLVELKTIAVKAINNLNDFDNLMAGKVIKPSQKGDNVSIGLEIIRGDITNLVNYLKRVNFPDIVAKATPTDAKQAILLDNMAKEYNSIVDILKTKESLLKKYGIGYDLKRAYRKFGE